MITLNKLSKMRLPGYYFKPGLCIHYIYTLSKHTRRACILLSMKRL